MSCFSNKSYLMPDVTRHLLPSSKLSTPKSDKHPDLLRKFNKSCVVKDVQKHVHRGVVSFVCFVPYLMFGRHAMFLKFMQTHMQVIDY